MRRQRKRLFLPCFSGSETSITNNFAGADAGDKRFTVIWCYGNLRRCAIVAQRDRSDKFAGAVADKSETYLPQNWQCKHMFLHDLSSSHAGMNKLGGSKIVPVLPSAPCIVWGVGWAIAFWGFCKSMNREYTAHRAVGWMIGGAGIGGKFAHQLVVCDGKFEHFVHLIINATDKTKG